MELSLPQRVTIREVGPRDGLQAERPLAVDDRVRLIDALSAAGFAKIEAVSFVSPKAVPAMGDADRVMAAIERRPGVVFSALVPNRKGAEAAVSAGADALQGFLAASDGYNRKNVGKSVEDSIADVIEVIEVGSAAGIPPEATISAAWGDPYEGDVDPERVVEIAAILVDAGAAGISLGDTIGVATPSTVIALVERFRARLADVPLNLHLHDTRGTAMANAVAALQAGITEFDASVGGLGGSPNAPGANSNLATEDFASMLAAMGIDTGLDLAPLVAASRLVASLVGHPVSARVPATAT